ncbi:hypothetical protein [Saccharothrix sp. Mg75]|uniref:hypothetical protein n=1 Tax=Saccharothrix sp. Mg75 TaxID=3445357 RepID=UPI003EEA476C
MTAARWLVLHARSREVPASLAVAAVGAVGAVLLGGLDRPGGSPQLTAFGAAVGVSALAAGFGGHDVDLDRTAAFRWPPRRAAHLLLGAAVVVGLLLAVGLAVDLLSAVGSVADPTAPDAVVLRDVAGFGGLAALGAVLFGARAAWVPPTAWAGATLVVPPGERWAERVLTWHVQPAGTTAATLTAVVLGVTGLLAYSAVGCRR